MSDENGMPGGDVVMVNPGDVVFTVGPGSKGAGVDPGEDGNFIFQLADRTEVMRIAGNGKVIIRGEEVDDNIVVYRTFLSWLRSATIFIDPVEPGANPGTVTHD